MKKYLIAGLLATASCTGSRDKKNEPAPLQEHGSFSFSKRGGGDMVDELYNDLSEKDPQLKQLEEALEQLNEQKTDSIRQFRNYDEKSKNYYLVTERHVKNITDSVLQQRVRVQIEKSVAAYKQEIAVDQSILDQVEIKTTSLNDLHEVLKIVKTLPVIADYQQRNHPSTRPLSFINKRYTVLLQQMDTLVNKQKL